MPLAAAYFTDTPTHPGGPQAGDCGKQASVPEELCAMANVKSRPWVQVKIAQCSRGHSPARIVDSVQDCVCLFIFSKV